ncbi:MAG: cryptochrome/photolyase family protein [Phycisphaerae bacterium]
MISTAFTIPAVRGEVRNLVVVFGDQLDLAATPIKELDKSRDAVLMMEVDEESVHVWSHKQRTALFLAAMRHFALDVAERGIRVRYVRLTDPQNTHSFQTEISRAIDELKPQRVRLTEPGEWRVADVVASISTRSGISFETCEDGHFLTSRAAFAGWMSGRKNPVMEHFYRWQRKRLDILIEKNGEPTGNTWNFDKQNRESFRSSPGSPPPYRTRPDDVTKEVLALVNERFRDHPGKLDDLQWPVTRREAQRALADFIAQRLPKFGTFQDAMWTSEPFLYHSLLSAPLNLKLLHPQECVDAAIEAFEAGAAPLPCVEGFVRQIIGWREFIRGIYWYEGRDYRDRNELKQYGTLPQLYWDGETDMRCMRESLGQVLEHGYGHHIQRLMVTGNFALLAGVHPRLISDWYLAMYVDAVDWVTLPNTLGMVMHADGGVVGTKPYAASGQYIKRMSNYCARCRFRPQQRIGDKTCPFTTFYWDFLIRNEKRFASNRRMKMMLQHVERMSGDEKSEIHKHADQLREQLDMHATNA